MNVSEIIKDKLNIFDVVSSYVQLEKSGNTYKGRSPFTNEKTPSFFVSPEKGFFYCFSSGKGGDIFTFIQEIERVDFKTALKILADKAGVTLEKEKQGDYDKQSRQYQLLDDATKWYEVQLRKNPEVLEYLYGRGINKDTIINYRLGYVPNEWREIYSYLVKKKYSNEEILESGLVVSKEGQSGAYYDRFRSRIMFPLMDAQGRVVAFSGRVFGDQAALPNIPKYLNSPETELFHKSSLLYGYHKAKTAFSKTSFCIVVEGQFDLLLAHQSGYLNTVAISGTGLTLEHLSKIKNFTQTLVFALDSDNAGVKATERSVLLAYQQDFDVRVVVMPEGLDPADLIQKSKEQWDVALMGSLPYLEYRTQVFDRQEHSFEEKNIFVKEKLFPFIAYIHSSIAQEKIFQKISLFLGVSPEAIRSDFLKYLKDEPQRQQDTTVTGVSISPEVPKPAVNLLEEKRKHLLFFWNFIQSKKACELPENFDIWYRGIYTNSLYEDMNQLDETLKNMHIFVYEYRYQDKKPEHLVNDFGIDLAQTYLFFLKPQQEDLLMRLRQAEGKGDFGLVKELLSQSDTLLLLKNKLEHYSYGEKK
jgi:DNA primase